MKTTCCTGKAHGKTESERAAFNTVRVFCLQIGEKIDIHFYGKRLISIYYLGQVVGGGETQNTDRRVISGEEWGWE